MTKPLLDGLILGADGKPRCWWCGEHDDYVRYHDAEWGRQVTDDRRLFEKLCLEGFQAGLSWLTILRKREGFREAFADFDIDQVAGFGPAEVEELLGNAGIVRHRGKIESVINNAKRAQELRREFGSIYEFVLQHRPGDDERPANMDRASLGQLGKTPASTRLSKDLKKRGWSFVGPTTVYAFMQAMGLVNDHIEGCWVRAELTN